MKKVKIKSINYATHDVVHIKTAKPQDLTFVPGQAVDVAINKPGWEEEQRPFTFTSLPDDDDLEFLIKTYPVHKGVTEEIGMLKPNDSFLIGEVFGDIQYKGEGVFIAGGAGITPFISIFKDLEKQNKLGNNKLIFANKTFDDIIEHEFFSKLLGKSFINVLSQEDKNGYKQGYISKEIIQSQMENREAYFYVCGPPPMMEAVLQHLSALGIKESNIVKEPF